LSSSKLLCIRLWICTNLYQFENKTPDINRFYFLFSALKKYSIAKAMKDFFALKQENIFQFIYQQFCLQIGITRKENEENISYEFHQKVSKE